MSTYPFAAIEKRWQRYWKENETFVSEENPETPKEKRLFILDMFPYPSGNGLHVGHPEGYTATDIHCRFLRMKGYSILHPMGFDSFGLPAENYAIQTGTHPKETTEKNIELFKKQLKSIGFSYDWTREISTHSVDYYRWTQWLFLKIYERGLAYESELPINWCKSCLTGLANEEVKEGRCERCGGEITRKNLRQWVLKITEYADRLLEDLDTLQWPESVKIMQREWIGRSEGANITFQIEGYNDSFQVYTTRPDTLFGATYMVLAPEHPLVSSLTTDEKRESVEAYIKKAAKKSDLERTDLAKEKTGVFTGAYAINPVNSERIPIWISDYILISYGTGAIMAVPGHDQRDWEFARQFDLPIVEVLKGGNIEEEAFTGDGELVNSQFLNGLAKSEAIEKITTFLEEKGLGERTINYRLRDWVFSRQRYWGEPIPIIHCKECGTIPLPIESLPLELPNVESYKPTGTGESPLAAIDEWVNTSCHKCGGEAKRETNTMPQWAGSCWYYLRFLSPSYEKAPFSPEAERYWMPVDLYVGGVEHAVLHLLYARFWHKVFYDLGLVTHKEPFQRLVNQGMITAYAYQLPNKSLVPSDEAEEESPGHFKHTKTGQPLTQVIAKMSKSLKNVENPDEIIKEYGADSLRVYEMFMGPLEVSKPWSTKGLVGVNRFLNRVWSVSQKELSDAEPTEEQKKLLHRTIKKVSLDTENMAYNTAIAQMMTFINAIISEEVCLRKLWEPFVLLISPYAPHIAEEMWALLGHSKTLAYEPWPVWVEELTEDSEKEIVLQVNGKLRARMVLPAGSSTSLLEKRARENSRVQEYIKGKTVVKVITVPDKLVNIVVR